MNKSSLWISTALLGALLSTQPARADVASDKPAVSRRLVAMTLTPESYQRMIAAVSGQLPPEARGEVVKMMPPYQEMADFQQGLFVKYFTVSEMEELAKFYASPVGAKSLKQMPEVAKDVQAMVTARLQAEMPKLIERLQKQQAEGKTDKGPAATP